MPVNERAMPGPPTGIFERDRQRHVQALKNRVAAQAEKLTWPLARIHARRDECLRDLLRVAKERAPWHSQRLRHVDPQKFTLAELSDIPAMTKSDLMSNWDDIVTDRRLTLDMANAHLDSVARHGPNYLLDYYMVIVSGGSTGERGVFAYDFEGWLAGMLPTARRDFWLVQHGFGHTGEHRVAVVMAALPIHVSVSMSRTFAGDVSGAFRILPVTLPTDRLVAALNEFDPTHLNIYPSLLPRLVEEQRRGQLRIRPHEILCSGEPLLAEIRHMTEGMFGRVINNRYGCSELVGAETFPGSPGLHLIEDVAVYEPVDAQGRRVRAGERAAKLLITNVTNQLLPLIRYELTDEVTVLDEPNPDPWTGRRIADIQGRLDDMFYYDRGVEVHPHVFRSRLGRIPEITAYQVRQTEHGATIFVQSASAIELISLRDNLNADLRNLGIPDADIHIEHVDSITRLNGTGKLKRFIPFGRSRGAC